MTLGFIVLRHVNSETTNKYWIECCESIRHFYPDNKIVIIDDNSNYDFITDYVVHNSEVIKSEFPGRGELLPYYYYSRNKWFDTAVILHDSVFIKKYMDFTVEKYKLLWIFVHAWDQIEDEQRMLNLLTNNTDLLKCYENKWQWQGCFGCMSVITHDYLKLIDNKYTLSNLLDAVITRYNRSSLERVIGCILMTNHTLHNFTLFGHIHQYCESVKSHFGYSYTEYAKDGFKSPLPLVKIWTGR